MMSASRRFPIVGALLSLATVVAAAAQAPPTALDRQLAHIDFSVSGVGEFTTNTSGKSTQSQPVSLRPSTTLGALVTLRYIKSPLVGFEFNYGYARYTENYNFNNLTPTGPSPAVLGIQTNVTEYTVGYVAHTPRLFGVQPFAAVGAGSLAFRPTGGGGQGFTPQARAAYFYGLGAENLVFGEHFGLRAQFRQIFFLAPDYQTNYLANKQRAVTSEPTVGFFIRF